MITFVIQTMDWLTYGQFHYFWLFFVYVWIVWMVKAIASRFYSGVADNYQTTVSVIVPVFREDYAIFDRVLASIASNQPDEIIVVPNGSRDEVIETIAQRYASKVISLPNPGKRQAQAVGIREATGDIIVIGDSDTIWQKDTLREMIKPFADPAVGGVTPNQQIFDSDCNFVRRFCDWMEDIRFTWSTPAQSVFSAVGCLFGRAIALRRHLLLEVLDEFLNEYFLGVKCETGDDRSFTNFVLKRGLRTVYQSSARVQTDCPNTWSNLIKQQIRWARSSQRETVRQIRWLVRKPFLAFCFLTDIVTPFFLVGVYLNIAWRLWGGTTYTPIIEGTMLANVPAQLAIAATGILLTMGVRQIPHFSKKPQDFWLLPVFVVALTFILTPIRIWGFMTMANNDWITRTPGREK